MKRFALAVAAALLAVAVAGSAQVQAKCGDKGGPGYRKANGKCASWKD